jgi:hypothetical protein
MNPSARVPAQRRDYTTKDYKHIAQHYPHSTARKIAAELGRTRGSLYDYIGRYPELRKRDRP